MNKKSKKYEQQADQAWSAANTAVASIKPSEDAKAIGTQAAQDWKNLRSGDVSKNPAISNYLLRSAAAKRRAETASPMGDASLATRIANPEAMAMYRDYLNRMAEQSDAEAVTGIAQQAEQDAVNRVYGLSDATMSAFGQQAGAYRGLSSDAFSRYQYMRQQGTFWSKLAKVGLTAAGAAIGGAPGAKLGAAIGAVGKSI